MKCLTALVYKVYNYW